MLLPGFIHHSLFFLLCGHLCFFILFNFMLLYKLLQNFLGRIRKVSEVHKITTQAFSQDKKIDGTCWQLKKRDWNANCQTTQVRKKVPVENVLSGSENGEFWAGEHMQYCSMAIPGLMLGDHSCLGRPCGAKEWTPSSCMKSTSSSIVSYLSGLEGDIIILLFLIVKSPEGTAVAELTFRELIGTQGSEEASGKHSRAFWLIRSLLPAPVCGSSIFYICSYHNRHLDIGLIRNQ